MGKGKIRKRMVANFVWIWSAINFFFKASCDFRKYLSFARFELLTTLLLKSKSSGMLCCVTAAKVRVVWKDCSGFRFNKSRSVRNPKGPALSFIRFLIFETSVNHIYTCYDYMLHFVARREHIKCFFFFFATYLLPDDPTDWHVIVLVRVYVFQFAPSQLS